MCFTSITCKRNPKIFQYFLMGEILNRVQKHDYLGVTIALDLRWNDHTCSSKFINKASRTLGLLCRPLSPCTKAVKAQAYSTLVHPQLKYASKIWNPNTTSEINRLEQVQRSSARFVFADYKKRNHITPLIHVYKSKNWIGTHFTPAGLSNKLQCCTEYSMLLWTSHFHRVSRELAIPHLELTIHLRSSTQIHPLCMHELLQICILRAVAIWNRLPARAILHINPSVSHFQEFAVPAIWEMSPLHGWLPCPVMLLPSFVYSAPFVEKKYFILEHLLCLVNELLFWSTFLFCPTGCRRQPCTHPRLADVCCILL